MIHPNVVKWAQEAGVSGWVLSEFSRQHPDYAMSQNGVAKILDAAVEIKKQNKNMYGLELITHIWNMLDEQKKGTGTVKSSEHSRSQTSDSVPREHT